MDIDASPAYTPHAGGSAHPLAQFALGRSPLTPGGVGQSDLFSPVSVLLNGGLRLTLPKGARRWRGCETPLEAH